MLVVCQGQEIEGFDLQEQGLWRLTRTAPMAMHNHAVMEH